MQCKSACHIAVGNKNLRRSQSKSAPPFATIDGVLQVFDIGLISAYAIPTGENGSDGCDNEGDYNARASDAPRHHARNQVHPRPYAGAYPEGRQVQSRQALL